MQIKNKFSLFFTAYINFYGSPLFRNSPALAKQTAPMHHIYLILTDRKQLAPLFFADSAIRFFIVPQIFVRVLRKNQWLKEKPKLLSYIKKMTVIGCVKSFV